MLGGRGVGTARGESSLDEVFVEPAMQPILAAMEAAVTEARSRSAPDAATMRVRAAKQFAAWNLEPPQLAGTRELEIPGAAGMRRARLYDPDGRSPAPLLLHLHGGGWVVGDLEIDDRALRVLALESGARIVSLDYRLAPEHPFPAALDDTVAAFGWLREHAREFGASPGALALGGASAGANLALAAALRMRDTALPLPAQLVLFHGVYGIDRDTESDRLFGIPRFSGPLLNMEFFYAAYAGLPEARRNPLVAPLLADLHSLPPCFVNAAGLDPLRDDSRRLGEALRKAGVPVDYIEYPGVVHGFTQYTRVSPAARRALADAGAAMRTRLEPERGN